MQAIFGGGSKPAPQVMAPPPPPPPAPSIDQAASRTAAENASRDAALRKRGRAAAVMTGSDGVENTPIAKKTLVGS